MFYCFMKIYTSRVHLYGKDPSLDKERIHQYFFVTPVGDEAWSFGEVSLHARPLRVKMLNPDVITPDDLKVLMEIHRDFGHDHDLLAKIMHNESVLIYYGLFHGHEWNDDMCNSSRVCCFCISVELILIWPIIFFTDITW